MSVEYDLYLRRHKENVRKGFVWIQENLPELVAELTGWETEFAHDASKTHPSEYEAYDKYFYGNNKSYQVVQDYKKAWLLHIHRNSHHWQHWILINDDPEEGEVVLEMPYVYILEMICDWWSFSWSTGDLTEMFKWYDEHKDYIKLHPDTRKKVEDILGKIREKLEKENSESELSHHGIKGQKWGVRNGPPYPLKRGQESVEKTEKSDKIDSQSSVKIPEEKFTKYALDPERSPDKSRAFKEALGYTKENYKNLIHDIERTLDKDKLVEKTDDGYGMRYEQVMELKGPNGKTANVLTGWIQDDNGLRLTSVYVTRKKAKK